MSGNCIHGYTTTETTEDVNPYTGEVETTTEVIHHTYMKYHTVKSDKCSKCGYIFDEY